MGDIDMVGYWWAIKMGDWYGNGTTLYSHNIMGCIYSGMGGIDMACY